MSKNIYFVQGIPTSYCMPDLFVFATKKEAESVYKKIVNFYNKYDFDHSYEIKEVDITNLNIKDNKLYCVVGAITPLETETWIFDTKETADAKEKELWEDPNRFVDAQFYIKEINLNNLDTITSMKEWFKEQKEFYAE